MQLATVYVRPRLDPQGRSWWIEMFVWWAGAELTLELATARPGVLHDGVDLRIDIYDAGSGGWLISG